MTENNYQMNSFGMHVLSDESELFDKKIKLPNPNVVAYDIKLLEVVKKSLPNSSDYDEDILKLIKPKTRNN